MASRSFLLGRDSCPHDQGGFLPSCERLLRRSEGLGGPCSGRRGVGPCLQRRACDQPAFLSGLGLWSKCRPVNMTPRKNRGKGLLLRGAEGSCPDRKADRVRERERERGGGREREEGGREGLPRG